MAVKIITGDNHLAAVGLRAESMLRDEEIQSLPDEALWHRAVFVEVDPNQKERIIQALQKIGDVVGCMGDWINDAADLGISVDSAVDVAKESADRVLMEHDLRVLSMAGASQFLPFLPLVANQVRLNNFLSDLPGMEIAGDDVDREWIEHPHR